MSCQVFLQATTLQVNPDTLHDFLSMRERFTFDGSSSNDPQEFELNIQFERIQLALSSGHEEIDTAILLQAESRLMLPCENGFNGNRGIRILSTKDEVSILFQSEKFFGWTKAKTGNKKAFDIEGIDF